MCQCFASKKEGAIPLFVTSEVSTHLKTDFQRTWFKSQPQNAQVYLVPNAKGDLEEAIVTSDHGMWVGSAAYEGVRHTDHCFYLANTDIDVGGFALSWALASYQFVHHKTSVKKQGAPKLYVDHTADDARIQADAIFLVRDLINTPADKLTPEGLAARASQIGASHGAKVDVIKGNDLKSNYPMVWAVGRASEYPPAVVDMKWGHQNHPKVTLIGKGVTFDSGGLDVKPASAMLLMKKDMGGAANALALAQMVMTAKLPICLRLILPCAENAIGSRSFRPSDILTSRKGTTVEVADTDAEGRLLLADALTAASEDQPDYILDFATLTGVARLAVGTEMGALFANDKPFEQRLMAKADTAFDPLWPLPLWSDYRKLLHSDVADIKSCSSGGYAGAITAALFLQQFVGPDIKWAHFDIMAWNVSHRPGRPVGGEAMGIRAAYAFIQSLKGER